MITEFLDSAEVFTPSQSPKPLSKCEHRIQQSYVDRSVSNGRHRIHTVITYINRLTNILSITVTKVVGFVPWVSHGFPFSLDCVVFRYIKKGLMQNKIHIHHIVHA